MSEVQTAETAEVKAPRVTKIGQAKSIFAAKLASREAGSYATNKAFRADVIATFVTDLGVNVTTASTMYNTVKNDAVANTPGLSIGRDPKKEKAPSTGKRGRPLGSKNKPKAVVVPAAEVATVESIVPSAQAQEDQTQEHA